MQTESRNLSPMQTVGLLAAAILIVGLLLLSGGGYLFSWPEMDEANYLLQARNMAQGMLPYRDFYEFITPGGQLLGALWSKLYGFSVISLRLWVFTGWLVELFLVYDMGKRQLSRPWLAVTLAFIALSGMRHLIYQHHFFSGFFALLAVYCLWRYLEAWYRRGQKPKKLLIAGGIFTAFTFWVTQSLGVLLTLALGVFSLLHCFLNEREEKNLTYREVANAQVFKRWLREWGLPWALPMLLIHVLAFATLAALGLWLPFWRDTAGWLLGGHYSNTTLLGYYVTFQEEMTRLMRPLIDGHYEFFFRIPLAFHLLWIGILPIIGLLGTGYQLPQRFLYRLLRLEDEALLLWWFGGLAAIIATMSYSSTMHIVSNGALAFLLGGWALDYWSRRHLGKAAAQWLIRLIALGELGILAGGIIGSIIIFLYGAWLPPFPPVLRERLVYLSLSPTAKQYLNVVQTLEKTDKGESVFIYNERPALYLTGSFKNATRYTIILPHYTSPSQMDEILRALKAKPPRYIVYDQTDRTLHTDPRFSRYQPDELSLPPLEAFIRENYTPKAQEGWWLIFERKP
jgi:hypothetical protein